MTGLKLEAFVFDVADRPKMEEEETGLGEDVEGTVESSFGIRRDDVSSLCSNRQHSLVVYSESRTSKTPGDRVQEP